MTYAELKDNTPAVSGGRKGDALPFTPEWSATLSTNYEWAVGVEREAYVGGSVRFLSDQTASYDAAFRAANFRQREVESYEVLDLQAGVDFGATVRAVREERHGQRGQDFDGRPRRKPLGSIGNGVIRLCTF